jgi:hypothetical protein
MMVMTWPVRKVAPKQDLLPHRFNYAKFKSINYIYNLSDSQPLSKVQLISSLDKLQKKYIFGLVIKQNNTKHN